MSSIMQGSNSDNRRSAPSTVPASQTSGILNHRHRVSSAILSLVLGSAALSFVGEAAAQACPPIVVTTVVSIISGLLVNDNCQIAATGVLTIDQPGSLTTTGGVTLSNAGNLNNNANLSNFGTLSNAGVLTNNGTLQNFDGLVNNGALHNFGTLQNNNFLSNRGALANDGTLSNLGTLSSSGTLNINASGSLSNTGTFNNSGILNTSGALTNTKLNNVAGTVNNNAGATLNVAAGGTLTNNQQLNNKAAARLNISEGGTLSNAGSFANMASSSGSAAVLNNFGTMSNTGSLDVFGTSSTSGASATLFNYGTLNNSGMLTTSHDASLPPDFSSVNNDFGGLVKNHGQLNNLASGAIVIGGILFLEQLVNIPSAPSSALSNAGSLTNNSQLIVGSGARLSNTGILTNNFAMGSGGLVINSGTLNNVAQYNNSGFLINEGGVGGGAGGILNSHYLLDNAAEVRNNGGSGLDSGGAVMNNYGLFTNRGVLENGAGTLGGGAAVLNNFGTIDNSGGPSVFSNYGTVNNSGSFSISSDSTMNNNAGATFANVASGTVKNSGMIVNDGAITNSGTFIVTATGRVHGIGTYTQTAGVTTVSKFGELSASSVQILGGVINGTGTIDPPAPIVIGTGAIVQPGPPIGTLTFQGDTQFAGELDIEIAGLANYDILKVVGGIAFGAGSKIKFIFGGYNPRQGDHFSFLDADSAEGFSNVAFLVAGLAPGFDFELRDAGNGNLEFFTTIAPTAPVPEPGTWLLLALGLGVIGLRRGMVARRGM